ncbi:MAG TPA: 2OG-Fe(II) oxygenase, partial [Candidatus Competibacteraceae bacterium]|nr:2OG-Fe(II) oxygenase [Candidatus Competibacteraceae bacterium]
LELLQAWAHGRFHSAGIGRGANHRLRPEIRSDRVYWLDESAGGLAQRRYLELLEALRLALNRELFLGLARFEGHFAVYPPGSHYRRHLDSFQGTRQRIVSTVLYLNPDWQVEDAGALRLYLPASGGERIVDVLPEDGNFVCFLSERIPHEVLPPRRRRLSVTGWFRLRD